VTQTSYSANGADAVPYCKSLQSLLRKGPDVVGVDWMGDRDTARLAVAAATDGRWVYACMNAAAMADMADRWTELAGETGLAWDVTAAALCQCLVRTICPACKMPYRPGKELFAKFNIAATNVGTFYRPTGQVTDKQGRTAVCQRCQGTGYEGRTAVFEGAAVGMQTRKELQSAGTGAERVAAMRRAGMKYLQEVAIDKAVAGTISIHEIIERLKTPILFIGVFMAIFSVFLPKKKNAGAV